MTVVWVQCVSVGTGVLTWALPFLILCRTRCHELDLGAVDQQLRVDVDAELLELERIQLRRQRRVGARLGQHRGARPGLVIGQLLRQRVERRLRAFDLVLREQLADAVDVGVDVAQRRSPWPAGAPATTAAGSTARRSEEHTSELQSLMRISY